MSIEIPPIKFDFAVKALRSFDTCAESFSESLKLRAPNAEGGYGNARPSEF